MVTGDCFITHIRLVDSSCRGWVTPKSQVMTCDLTQNSERWLNTLTWRSFTWLPRLANKSGTTTSYVNYLWLYVRVHMQWTNHKYCVNFISVICGKSYSLCAPTKHSSTVEAWGSSGKRFLCTPIMGLHQEMQEKERKWRRIRKADPHIGEKSRKHRWCYDMHKTCWKSCIFLDNKNEVCFACVVDWCSRRSETSWVVVSVSCCLVVRPSRQTRSASWTSASVALLVRATDSQRLVARAPCRRVSTNAALKW